jgi:acyl-lipid omega-6 desaturase (Delta-12 desaturase)
MFQGFLTLSTGFIWSQGRNVPVTMHEHPDAPLPASLVHLRPSDAAGLGAVALASGVTIAGAWLALQPSWGVWAGGQVVIALGLIQWFVLLHEAGHMTLFRHRRLNACAGYLAGFLALIPFPIWKRIHQRHHKWTGWQDLDPTTATLVPRPLSAAERWLVRVCWRYWIPLFSVLYRLNNFWNPLRLVRLFAAPLRHRLCGALLVSASLYGGLVWWLGPLALARTCGVALVLAFVVQDILILSQHTHIPMGLSHGAPVEPYPTLDQQPFTRSLRLPEWFSRVVLRFDQHELHHMYPFVPGYRLDEVPFVPGNEVSWRTWVPAARAVPGDVLLFQSRKDSGFDV